MPWWYEWMLAAAKLNVGIFDLLRRDDGLLWKERALIALAAEGRAHKLRKQIE